MRYQKPVVMDLGRRTRHAQGQGPLACISGSAASGLFESCGNGTWAGLGCNTGNSAGPSPPCVGGSSADHCFAGTGVSFYCGAGASGSTDPYGCNVGPSV